MEIALLNTRITFQKNETVVDEIGNHINEWINYYICHATVSGEGGVEVSVAGIIVDNSDISFTVRFCKKAAAITNTGFRILFNEEIYDIQSVDHMNYKKKCLKFKCKKARR